MPPPLFAHLSEGDLLRVIVPYDSADRGGEAAKDCGRSRNYHDASCEILEILENYSTDSDNEANKWRAVRKCEEEQKAKNRKPRTESQEQKAKNRECYNVFK
jgi:hypothetical protein